MSTHMGRQQVYHLESTEEWYKNAKNKETSYYKNTAINLNSANWLLSYSLSQARMFKVNWAGQSKSERSAQPQSNMKSDPNLVYLPCILTVLGWGGTHTFPPSYSNKTISGSNNCSMSQIAHMLLKGMHQLAAFIQHMHVLTLELMLSPHNIWLQNMHEWHYSRGARWEACNTGKEKKSEAGDAKKISYFSPPTPPRPTIILLILYSQKGRTDLSISVSPLATMEACFKNCYFFFGGGNLLSMLKINFCYLPHNPRHQDQLVESSCSTLYKGDA